MSKQVQIPINEFDYYSTDGTYVGIKFRYRLKQDSTDNNVSKWSEINELIFKGSNDENITLSEANGYDKPTSLARTNSNILSSLKWTSADNKMMPSQIDQIISQASDLSNTYDPEPKNELYRMSWTVPENFNVNNFDIFLSWRNIVFLNATADISAPTVSGANFTGTITLTGGGSTIRSQTIKSYYDWLTTSADTPDLVFYATPGSRTPGNTFTVTGYTGETVFSIRSADTWVGSGNITNVSRNSNFTEPEYTTTIDTNRYEFPRKMTSNKASAIIASGSSIIQLNKNPALLNLSSGMKLTKKSGDGVFGSGATISQIDYQNNRLFISTSNSATTTASTTGTIGTVTSSGGVWSATITNMSSTSELEVGYMICATAGTGNFGAGIVRVASIVSGTSITITSNKVFTAGTITNIIAMTRNNHQTSGYIEFVGDVGPAFNITFSGKTVKHYWSIPHYCQGIISAPTRDKDYLNLYTLLSVTEAQFLYFGGFGQITGATTSAPFTATLTELNMPYNNLAANSGYRIYGNPTTTGGGSFGNGEVKVARYISGISMGLVSTAAMTNGYVYGVRL